MKRAIIIGGGVGPMAGTDLHRHIIFNTKTDGTDQDHIDVIHLSYASVIADRTAYLLGNTEVNPGLPMAKLVEQGYRIAEFRHQEAVAGIPCNTFHAPEIFTPYTEHLNQHCPKLHLSHMLDETLQYLHEVTPGLKRVGLFSTTGTRRSRIWHNVLEQAGIETIELPEELQQRLHEDIYHPKWGIKALSKVAERVRLDFDGFCQMLLEQEVEAIILGCTELPLIFPENIFLGVPLIDPMAALARGLIRTASPDQLLPLSELT